MPFAIHKKPVKVALFGLVALWLVFAFALVIFRKSDYFYLILGGGVFGSVLILLKSVGSIFVSALTVTDTSIETVTPVGGIIKINFDDLDWERTHISGIGCLLVPNDGESIQVSIIEYSGRDIARLVHHILDVSGDALGGPKQP